MTIIFTIENIHKALLSPEGKKILLKPIAKLMVWFAIIMLLMWVIEPSGVRA